MSIDFGVLGDTCAKVDQHPIELGHSRQRSVLAVLIVSVNRPISTRRLVDHVWGETPPQRAVVALRSYLSRLRSALGVGGCEIVRNTAGYILKVDELAVDLHRFRALAAQARASNDLAEAVQLFDDALTQWRGEAFADVDSPWLADMRYILEAERVAAQLDYYEICLQLGRHVAVLPGLLALSGAYPLDERLGGLLMLALYRAGSQATALSYYERIRIRIADDLGTDPSPALRKLHQKILVNDPELDPERIQPAYCPPVSIHYPMSV